MRPHRQTNSKGWVRYATLATSLLVGGAGCTRNYYYGAVPPGCLPATVAAPAMQVGSVCDASTAASPVIIQGNSQKPKAVVSQSGSGWRRADPEIQGSRDDWFR